MNSHVLAALGWLILWVVTFPISWWLVLRLSAQSIEKKYYQKTSFWLAFIGYLFVMLLPYLFVIIFEGRTSVLGTILLYVLAPLVIVSVIFRFIGTTWLIRILWYVYGWFYDGLRNFFPYTNLLRLSVGLLSPKGSEVILDLGCGTGNATELIAANPDVMIVAVDSSKSMLVRARNRLKKSVQRGQVQVVESDLLTFLEAQPANSFDKILMLNVVYAVTNREKLWEHSFRILKKNGVMVITNSDRPGSKAIIREHLDNASFWKLLYPNLIMVSIIDNYISQLSHGGAFSFVSQKQLGSEIHHHGGKMGEVRRCYGGEKDGVNLLFDVTV